VEVIDAHVHVGPPNYAPVEDYLTAMSSHGLRRAVLVQQLAAADNDYLVATLTQHPTRFVGIAIVDHRSTRAAAQLEELAAHHRIRGIRLPAIARSPGQDPWAIWRLANRLKLDVSVAGPFDAVISPDMARIVDECPDTHFRFEHLGCLRFSDDPPPYLSFRKFLRLAARPNTSTTWSGFFLNSARPYPYRDARPFLEQSFEAFGAHRIMWSGDWNRSAITDQIYHQAMSLVRDNLDFLTDSDRAAIMGGTAARAFRLDEAA
jgi:L-fuconolactonase